jgi:hypothetical protein
VARARTEAIAKVFMLTGVLRVVLRIDEAKDVLDYVPGIKSGCMIADQKLACERSL